MRQVNYLQKHIGLNECIETMKMYDEQSGFKKTWTELDRETQTQVQKERDIDRNMKRVEIAKVITETHKKQELSKKRRREDNKNVSSKSKHAIVQTFRRRIFSDDQFDTRNDLILIADTFFQSVLLCEVLGTCM